MGVPGLWDARVLRPTGKSRALAHVAVEDGFVSNTHGHRGYRIGIDASIWFFHALGGREGENPELRTLFFRCARLLAMPYLPIFVFDGPGRPKIKRGKAVGGKEHWLVNSLRSVLDAFGFECRTAPGEAEAELAFLNRIGVIDAVLSDDVDCFLFGAHTVMRNGSATLSGNRAHGAGDPQHVYVYHARDIAAHPAVGLSQGGLILIALLRGGDYDGTGIEGCGVSAAHALARAGFGDTLLAAAHAGPAALAAFLPTWRAALCHELRTNASGHAPRKCPAIAARITDSFPSLEVLRCYAHPLTSERAGQHNLGLSALWARQADVGKLAHVCERFFEWGVEDTVVKRFRTVIWPGAVLRVLLQAARARDTADTARGGSEACGSTDTPSKVLARSLDRVALDSDSDSAVEEGDNDVISPTTLLTKIHGTRRHASTDHVLEYRVELRPHMLVAHTRAGMRGLRVVMQDSTRVEDDGEEDGEEEGKGKWVDPESVLRVWMPAVVLQRGCPRLVRAFEAKETAKTARKAVKGKGKGQKTTEEGEDGSPVRPKMKSKPKKKAEQKVEDESENERRQSKKTDTKHMSATLQPRQRQDKDKDDNVSIAIPEAIQRSLENGGFLLDDDPFLAPTYSQPPAHGHPERQRIPSTLRPFPMSLNEDPTDLIPARPCQHTASQPASFHGSDTSPRHLKKLLRKSAEQTSPRKTVLSNSTQRSPSESPMRPLERRRIRPTHEEVIVISSDSDSPIPPLAKARARPKSTIAPSQGLDGAHVVDLT